MKIRIIKKLLALMWYKIGDEFEAIREDKARLGNSHLFLETYIVKIEGTERMILKQDAEVMEDSKQKIIDSIQINRN